MLIYIHMRAMLASVQPAHPARRYVMVDDKQRVLTAMKEVLGERLVTVFPRQGHYAHDPANIARYPAADCTVERIGDLLNHIGSLPLAPRHRRNHNANTQKLHALGQSLWIDNITREMLGDGTLARYIAELSVTGLTSNPTIFEHAIGGGDSYDKQIAELSRQKKSGEDLLFALALQDLTRAADLFRPIHDATGTASTAGSRSRSSKRSSTTRRTIESAAARLHAAAARPNLYIKIPARPPASRRSRNRSSPACRST